MYESEVEAIVRDLRWQALNAPLVGIDGPGGSGKSTLARELAERLGAVIVEADDFYRPSGERTRDPTVGGEYDWRRLEAEVLVPVSHGRSARYERYDWASDRLVEWREVPPAAVIVEGVYVLRKELIGYYCYRVWVEARPEVRLRRGLERDGDQARDRWAEWMRSETAYVAAHRPEQQADRRVVGEPGVHDW